MKSSNIKLTMKEYPPTDRPIEKMLKRGVDSLSDEELLAVIIGSGTKDYNALELADQILRQERNRTWLLKASVDELLSLSGIGPTKACRILAGLELGRRLSQVRDFHQISLSSPKTVARYFKNLVQGEDRELFCVLLLDVKNRPIRKAIVSIGTKQETIIHPREVFRSAIRSGASSILLLHNHPSGDPSPSPEDIRVTKRLVMAGKILNIPVLDHVVVADQSYVSFKEKGIF